MLEFMGEKNMKNNPRVFIIIPIYNVEPYLRECIDSVVNQTYTNIRVILVNDGSTDKSEEIAKEYLNDLRVILISKENGGQSSARNAGLKQAYCEGDDNDYILFLDSDDYIELNYVSLMIESFKKHPDSVISFGGCTSFNHNGILNQGKDRDENYSCSGIHYLGEVPNHYFCFSWGGGCY